MGILGLTLFLTLCRTRGQPLIGKFHFSALARDPKGPWGWNTAKLYIYIAAWTCLKTSDFWHGLTLWEKIWAAQVCLVVTLALFNLGGRFLVRFFIGIFDKEFAHFGAIFVIPGMCGFNLCVGTMVSERPFKALRINQNRCKLRFFTSPCLRQ